MAKFVELVLTALQYQTEGMFTIADTLLDPQKYFYRIPINQQRWFKTSWAEAYRNRQQFYNTLNRLKHQGLVTKKRQGKSGWFLTEPGEERLTYYQKLRKDLFSSAHVAFPKTHGEGITVVAFDVPEKERRKRDWTRECLTEMGFQKLQKSVWVAHGKVHEDFIHALRERNLLDYVHIFAVTKRGMISSLDV